MPDDDLDKIQYIQPLPGREHPHFECGPDRLMSAEEAAEHTRPEQDPNAYMDETMPATPAEHPAVAWCLQQAQHWQSQCEDARGDKTFKGLAWGKWAAFADAAEAVRGMLSETTPAEPAMQTDEDTAFAREIDVAEKLGDVWNHFLNLPVQHNSDREEFMRAIHAAQNIVLSRAARRKLNERP